MRIRIPEKGRRILLKIINTPRAATNFLPSSSEFLARYRAINPQLCAAPLPITNFNWAASSALSRRASRIQFPHRRRLLMHTVATAQHRVSHRFSYRLTRRRPFVSFFPLLSLSWQRRLTYDVSAVTTGASAALNAQ